MGFQEQIYSLAYLTERKPFWFLPWTTALPTKPVNNSNTDPETQTSSKRVQYYGMVKDEVPQHSSTLLQRADHRREGGKAAHHAPAHPSSPSCAGSCQRHKTPGASGGRRAGRQLCPRTYLAQPHLSTTWGALPGPLCRSCSPGERSKSQGAESTRGHLLQRNVTKDTSPRCVWRKPRGITVVKEMLGKLFDWNITVNRREN